MYVYKNKESGLYLVLSLGEMYFFDGTAIDWYVSETDEVSFASKFGFIENLEYYEDLIQGFNLEDWEAEYIEL